MNMKTNSLPIIGYLAAIAAFALLPVSAVVAAIAFSVTGMISVFAADYGRNLEPVRVTAQVVALEDARLPSAELRTAA
jgi:hypothetical protein